MIVINRKRIQIILSCLFIAIFAFSFQIANNNELVENTNTNSAKQQATVQTTATPVSGKTIVVDAGHGVPDEGAQSSTRYNRSRNKPKNCIKVTEFTRNKWKHGYINTF